MFVLLWTKMSGGHSRIQERRWARFETAEQVYRHMTAHPEHEYVVVEGEPVTLEATVVVKSFPKTKNVSEIGKLS